MTSLSGEFFCFACRRYKPVAVMGIVQTARPHCKACEEVFAARQTTKAKAIARRKANRNKRAYAADGRHLAESIRYLTKGGG